MDRRTDRINNQSTDQMFKDLRFSLNTQMHIEALSCAKEQAERQIKRLEKTLVKQKSVMWCEFAVVLFVFQPLFVWYLSWLWEV